MTIVLQYTWRQLKMFWATILFGWAIKLTPSDTHEYLVLAKCATTLAEAARNSEDYKQYKARMA